MNWNFLFFGLCKNKNRDQLQYFFRVVIVEGGMSSDAACVCSAHQQPCSSLSLSLSLSLAQTQAEVVRPLRERELTPHSATAAWHRQSYRTLFSNGCLLRSRLLTPEGAPVAAWETPHPLLVFLGNCLLSTTQREPYSPPFSFHR